MNQLIGRYEHKAFQNKSLGQTDFRSYLSLPESDQDDRKTIAVALALLSTCIYPWLSLQFFFLL